MSDRAGERHARLLLHQNTLPSGELEDTWLELETGKLQLRVGDHPARVVPVAVLDAVMKRYGRPLAEDTRLDGPHLLLASGERLMLLRHLARFDVVAKDYLVYEPPGASALAELATSVCAALSFVLLREAGHAAAAPG